VWNIAECNRTDHFGALYKVYPTMTGKFESIWERDGRDGRKARKNLISLPAQVRSLYFPSTNLYFYSYTVIGLIGNLSNFHKNVVPLSEGSNIHLFFYWFIACSIALAILHAYFY
jgi:hypothetical protein